MENSSTYSELLVTNLEILFTIYPPSAELRTLLQKDLFSVPNKRASDELICYLFSIIDEKKYNIKQIYFNMELDKKIENTFYSRVQEYSKEIRNEYPEENLPNVVKSFFLTPSGKKYVQYLYKLTLIAMKKYLKVTGNIHPARRCRDEEELTKFETVNDMLHQNLKTLRNSAEESYTKNKIREKLLKRQIEKIQKVLMELTADLKLTMEKCSLPEHMKSLDFSEHDQKVIKEWSTVLSQSCEKLEKHAEVIRNIKCNISQLNKAITEKRNLTPGKCSSYFGNKECLNGPFPENFVYNVLREAEETLNAIRLEGPANLTPYITELQELTMEFEDFIKVVSQCSELIIQLHEEVEAQTPQLEAAFQSEQLKVKNIEDEATSYGHSLITKLCENTPPEMLRNLRIAELKSTPPMENNETESQNVSGAVGAELHTPVALDTNLLKPICFEQHGGSTWKNAVLLSTLKKKRQQKENSICDFENGMVSSGSLTDTPLSQPNKRTSVKSLNNFWTQDSENCNDSVPELCKRLLQVEVPSHDESPEKSSETLTSAVSNQIQTVRHILGRPDSRSGTERLNHIFPGLNRPSSEAVKNLIIQDRNKVGPSDLPVQCRPNGRQSSEEDSTRFSEVFTSGNISQEINKLMESLTNSHGSLMGASSVFDESSSPSPPGSTMTGIHTLESTRLDFMSSYAETALAQWDDEKELKRILSVALSPAGISPSEVHSSTPINSNSPPQEQNDPVKKSDNTLLPAAAARAVSRIPRINQLHELRLKSIRRTLSQEAQF